VALVSNLNTPALCGKEAVDSVKVKVNAAKIALKCLMHQQIEASQQGENLSCV
jgi:hypothetical protein